MSSALYRTSLALLLLSAPDRSGTAGQVKPPPEGAPRTPALERLLEGGGRVERVATGFGFAEGPVWDVAGHLIFTDVTRNRILRWHGPDQVTPWLDESGGAYGLARHPDGGLVAAQYGARQVSRVDQEGSFSVLANAFGERPLNGPTDVAIGPEGAIYFTDPRQAAARGRDAASAVYRIAPGGAIEAVVDDVGYPNGVAISSDGRSLYVSDGPAQQLRVYEIGADGNVGAGRVLASVQPWKRGVLGVPDGIAIDAEGRLFLAGPGGVWVLDASGGRLGVIATPETPSNCAFGGADGQTLYITARTSLYRVRLKVAGAS